MSRLIISTDPRAESGFGSITQPSVLETSSARKIWGFTLISLKSSSVSSFASAKLSPVSNWKMDSVNPGFSLIKTHDFMTRVPASTHKIYSDISWILYELFISKLVSQLNKFICVVTEAKFTEDIINHWLVIFKSRLFILQRHLKGHAAADWSRNSSLQFKAAFMYPACRNSLSLAQLAHSEPFINSLFMLFTGELEDFIEIINQVLVCCFIRWLAF